MSRASAWRRTRGRNPSAAAAAAQECGGGPPPGESGGKSEDQCCGSGSVGYILYVFGPYPDPLVRDTDPNSIPSINKQN